MSEPENNPNLNEVENSEIKRSKNRVKSTVRRICFSILALAILGGIAYEAYQNNMIPGVRRTVDIPPTYDNKADKQYVSLGANTKIVTTDDLPTILDNGTKPLAENSFINESMIFPVKVSPGEQIEVETSYVEGIFNPVMGGELDRLPVGKILTIPKSETAIMVSLENAEIFQFTPYIDSNTGKSYFNGIALQYFGPDGTRYVLRVISDYIDQFVPLDTLKNVPVVSPLDLIHYNPNAQKGKGLSLPPGTSILKTIASNARIEFDLDSYSPNYLFPRTSYNFSFKNSQDNKIFVVASSDNN